MESSVDNYEPDADLLAELQRAREQVKRANVARQVLLALTAAASFGMVFAGAAIANIGMIREGSAFCIFGAIAITGCAAWNPGRGRNE